MTMENENYAKQMGIQLSEELTMQIIAEIGKKSGTENPKGPVQVLIPEPDGTTLLGVDGRAVRRLSPEQAVGNILTVHNTATIRIKSSCIITVVRDGYLESWEFPDSFCSRD